MIKQLFLGAIFLVTTAISFGQLTAEDYSVYATIIKNEISDSTKSVAIIKSSIGSTEKHEKTFLTAEQLASKNVNDKYQVYGWTENNKQERPSIIDSNFALLIIDYCKSNVETFKLMNNFNQPFKTELIKKYPIRRKSIQQDWNNFYEKYPGSGGIFSFSNIKYYTQNTTAVIYYWVRRNGLNGHGALAVLTMINGEWQMKYKTYLWWN